MKTKSKSSAIAREKAIAAKAALMDQLEAFEDEEHGDPILARILHFSAKYSARNAMLIVMQNPEATEVAGFKAWQERGRQVRKGEHGIRILAPAGRGEDEVDATGKVAKQGRQFFRLISVFDIAQTDDVEDLPPVEPIDWEAVFADEEDQSDL